MSNEKRILIVTDAWRPQVNGVVRTYEHLQEELVKAGHTVLIIAPSDFPLCMPLPGYSEIKLVLFPYKKLAQKIKDFAPDHIHIGTEGPLGKAARKYCIKHNIAFVTAYHTEFPAYAARRVAKILPKLEDKTYQIIDSHIRKFHAPAAGIIVTTPTLEASLRERHYNPNLFQMVRGVPLDVFFPGEKTLFRDLPQPVALYVGRVAIEKNLEAFLEMDWEGSKIIVGEGPDLKKFKKQYPGIHFAGLKTGDELAEHYRSADVFVFPSKTDTFGIVIIEALACGLPVAGYNVTGPKDIITESSLGALHQNDLKTAVTDALNANGIVQDRHNFVRDRYSWTAAAKDFVSILEEHSA